MKNFSISFALMVITFHMFGQTNSYPSSGDVKIFATSAAWAEGLAVVKSTGWAGIRFDRTDPSLGNYNGNWAVGFTAATGNDLSFSTQNGSTQFDGILHLSNSTRNIGVGTTLPDWHFEVGGVGTGKGVIMATGQEAFVGWYDRSLKSTSINNRWGWYANNGSTFLWDNLNTTNRMTITNTGNVGIGTNSPNQKLTVNGTIYGKEVKVDLAVPGPDYVFEKDYTLPSLESIQTYINQNKHLPEVPSAKEMETNGINLSEMNMLLLKKVEELTLYVLEQNKKLSEQQTKLEEATTKIDKQQKQLELLINK